METRKYVTACALTLYGIAVELITVLVARGLAGLSRELRSETGSMRTASPASPRISTGCGDVS
jgi:hypothetical protein